MKNKHQANILRLMSDGKPHPIFEIEGKLKTGSIHNHIVKLRRGGYITKYGTAIKPNGRPVPTFKITDIGRSAVERYEGGYYE